MKCETIIYLFPETNNLCNIRQRNVNWSVKVKSEDIKLLRQSKPISTFSKTRYILSFLN